MIGFSLNVIVLASFILSFFSIVNYAKDGLFIKQAGIFALRSHYIQDSYQETLHQYTLNTTQKAYDFQSTKLSENKSKTMLHVNACKNKPASYAFFNLSLLNHCYYSTSFFMRDHSHDKK